MGFLSWFKYILLLLSCCYLTDVEAFNPFVALKEKVSKFFSSGSEERCDANWIVYNMTGLRSSLENRLHGQHLVNDVVTRSIQAHVLDQNPGKALVLSLHGWPGSGKTYTSNMVVNNLYKKGMDSKYVHLFVATLHFPHQSRLEMYKDQLHKWIKGNVTKCEKQLFIFDALDKLPIGLLDAIKPFLDTHTRINGINYRKSIFIFISNTGGDDISKHALAHWRLGKERNHITLNDMEEFMYIAAYNEKGGPRQSMLLKHDLVSAYIPFLPLERKHIKLCIEDDFKRKRLTWTKTQLSIIADDLQYMPAKEKVFSKSGCKRVPEKVNQLMEETIWPV